MKPTAIILTGDFFHSAFAKTAHGLIRSSDKYEILGLVSEPIAGQDAGEALDGKKRNIPAYGSLDEVLANHSKIDYAIIGVANPGGIIPDKLKIQLFQVLDNGISVVNGLHSFLSDIPEYREKAATSGAQLLDIRKAKPRKDLKFWSGSIFEVKCPIVAILGTDCAVGKRTTTKILLNHLKEQGVNAEMIYTGQTGSLQNDGYGFIFDSTLNDFVSGELEHAIVQCYRNRQPDVILLEGQAALLNPSGPCGSEYLISANAKKVILQHAPGRTYYKGWDHLDLRIPSISKTMKLVECYDGEVIGISLSGSTGNDTPPLSKEEMDKFKVSYREEYNMPVIDPVYDEIAPLAEAVIKLIDSSEYSTTA